MASRKKKADEARTELNEAFEQDAQVRTARLGIEIERAKSSALGRLIIERARQQATEAKEALVLVPATDTPAILELQISARMGDAIEHWIEDTIERGQAAEQALREEEAADGSAE